MKPIQPTQAESGGGRLALSWRALVRAVARGGRRVRSWRVLACAVALVGGGLAPEVGAQENQLPVITGATVDGTPLVLTIPERGDEVYPFAAFGGDAYAVFVTATDPDGDDLTYSWNGPTGCRGFNPNSRNSPRADSAAIWTAPALQAGQMERECLLTITVRDGNGGEVTGRVDATIVAPRAVELSAPATVEVGESDLGTAEVFVMFRFPGETLEVDRTITPTVDAASTAEASDYVALMPFTIPAGTAERFEWTFNINGDLIVENDETLIIQFAAAPGASFAAGADTTTVTIFDNNIARIEFLQADRDAGIRIREGEGDGEGDGGGDGGGVGENNGQFGPRLVMTNGPAEIDVTVRVYISVQPPPFMASANPLSSGSDYTAGSGFATINVVIPAGRGETGDEVRALFGNLIDDDVVEPDEVAFFYFGETQNDVKVMVAASGSEVFAGESDHYVRLTVLNDDSTAPVADAGPDQTVAPGETVTLDGSASSDPNNDPPDLGYVWTLDVDASSIITGFVLNDETPPPAMPTFVMPPAAAPGDTVVFGLAVVSRVAGTVGVQSENEARVTITVAANQAPTVDSISPGDFRVALNGTQMLTAAATDPEGGVLTYAWSGSSGCGIFSSDNTATTTWTAPGSTQTCTLFVAVMDSGGRSADGQITATVIDTAIVLTVPASMTVAEGDTGTSTVTLSIAITGTIPAGGLTLTPTVEPATTAETAVDYEVPVAATIPAGATSFDYTFNIIADRRAEA